MTVYREKDVKVVLGVKHEGTYGAQLADGSLDRMYPMRSASPMKRAPKLSDDAAEINGSELITRQEVELWDAGRKLEFDLDAFMAAWIGAFGLGAVTSARLQKVGSITHAGTGKTTMTAAGTGPQGAATPGATPKNFVVEIEAGGASFQWSNDGGATQEATGVAITGAAQALEDGVTVTFADLSGYTAGDTFSFATTNTSAYQHTCVWSDPDTVGRQNPSTTIVEDRDGKKRYVLGLAVDSFELSGKAGDRPIISADLVGSGEVADATGFVMPAAFSAAKFLRWSGLQFQLGPSGSLVVENSRLRDFSLKNANDLDKEGGYIAGGGYYRNRLLYANARKIEFSFTLARSADTELDAIEGQTALQAALTFTGRDAISDGIVNTLTVTIHRLQYGDHEIVYDKGEEQAKLKATVMYDPVSGRGLTWTVVNDSPTIMVAE
mgnify:CR=1 FL=1